MNITDSDLILLGHAGLGMLGSLLAGWVFFEALHARKENAARTRNVALAVAASMAAVWILGGYWYVHLYPADRAVILKGPWPFAHSLFMEVKEHLFFVTLILSFYLPIAARDRLYANAAARRLVMCVALLIALSAWVIEGAGGVIEHGAKLALIQADAKGAR